MPKLSIILNWIKIRAALNVVAIGVVAVVLACSAPAWAQDYDYPEGSSNEPAYPGIPPQGKVETTVGSQQLRFYGTVLLNASVTDSVEVGQDLVLWPQPAGNTTFPDGTTRPNRNIHDLVLSARQSVFGVQIKPPTRSTSEWQASGTVEFDFFGGRPFDGLQPQGRAFNQPRLRLGYFQLEKGSWKIVAGQDRMVVAPLDPVSLSHVAAPLGATAGNLWGWQPQLRAEWKNDFGNASTLLQFGVVRPQFADARLENLPATGSALDTTSSGLGERSGKPFYQARFSATFPMAGSKATIGSSGHYGRERIGAKRDIDSWAYALDFSIPFHSRVKLRGEAFVGSNLIPFQGGVLQGVAVFNPGGGQPIQFHKIPSGGGWGELILRATSDNKNVFYLGVGTDDPRDRSLLPGSTRSDNTFAWASYFRKLTDNVTGAFEWSNWQFDDGNSHGNVFNLSLAYQF